MAAGHRGALPSIGHCVPQQLFLLLFPSLLLQSELALAAGNYLFVNYANCMRNATSRSANFTRNLDTALRNLTTLSSQGSKYAITTVGSGAAGSNNTVYAMFQCRGDQSVDLCSECMQNATGRLQQLDCPNSVGARIQLDGCYVRYDNQSFFVLDTSWVTGLCNPTKTSNVAVLTARDDVMGNATSQAPKQGGFATATASGVYALVQCLGYLNETECFDCLQQNTYRTVCDTAVGGRTYLASCYYRYETYSFFEAPSPPPLAPPAAPPLVGSAPPHVADLPPPPPPPPPPTKLPGPRIAIGVVGGVIIATALCAMLAWRYKASKGVDRGSSWRRELLQSKARAFTWQELQEATGHFHLSNKLGAGGFGVVYKGTLSSGEQVAVKKLSIERQEGKEEFLNEVNLITSVQHKHLIRLLGCCVEGRERILVYEYVPNKSLDFSLFGDSSALKWSVRYGIILGMAKGLAYLHEESNFRIIHRDIKPSNILLDDQLDPVIADFGIAKLMEENASNVNTRVAGTAGYVAPEYALYGEFSAKVDVFSFGLVSLEVCTGKKNRHGSLLTWVWENYQHGRALNLVDEKLGNVFSPEEVIRVVHIGLLCTQENPKQRPAMSMVTRWLSGTSAILEVPTRPTFLRYSESMEPMDGVNDHFTSALPTSSQSMNSGGQVSKFSGQAQSFTEIEPR